MSCLQPCVIRPLAEYTHHVYLHDPLNCPPQSIHVLHCPHTGRPQRCCPALLYTHKDLSCSARSAHCHREQPLCQSAEVRMLCTQQWYSMCVSTSSTHLSDNVLVFHEGLQVQQTNRVEAPHSQHIWIEWEEYGRQICQPRPQWHAGNKPIYRCRFMHVCADVCICCCVVSWLEKYGNTSASIRPKGTLAM